MRPRRESAVSGAVADERSQSLIMRARAGEEEALHELIQTWRTYLLNVAELELDRQLHPKKGASDLVQSACLGIFEHFRDFRGDTVAEWKSWLLQLLRRDVQDVRRRFRDTEKRDLSRERRLVDWSRLQWELTDDDPSPCAALIASEESTALRAALQRLSDEHRQVIRLRNWEEASFAEIGRQLNLSEDSARKVWSRAVAKLQAELNRVRNGP